MLERGLERGIYERHEAVFQAVERDEAKAALLPLAIASWFARGKPELVVIPLREPTLEAALGVATRAEDRTLTEAVDTAIEHLLRNNAIGDVLARYGAVAPK